MQLGRYQILKQLATGTVADVLLARASGLEGFARHVVIKRIRPEMAAEDRFVKAFLEEARIAGSLHHQNIVTVHDIGEQDGTYFFAMEYVHGEDGRRLIGKVRERGEHIPLEHALSIVMAAAAGLHYAHEQSLASGERLGLVHRDVSPQNILIGYDGSVKLVDFGMAKAVARSTTTMTGILKGKSSYMSPEQCTGKPIDRRTDVFGLGIVLYELITAQRLFKGANEFMTMAAIVEGVIPKPSTLRREVPPALDEIMLRALHRSPESRYQTAEALRESLEAFALAQELRTSHKALSDYLTGLFGQRPEPWEVRASTDAAAPEIDYESTNAKGLVPTPTGNRTEMLARLAVRAESPIMQAEAADGEWDDSDEDVRTLGGGSPGATFRRGSAWGTSDSEVRTEPTSTVDEARTASDRRQTSTGNDSQPLTAVRSSRPDDVTRTEPVATTAPDTATDLPVVLDDAAATASLRAAPRSQPPPTGGDDTENRTVLEPFDSTADRHATDEAADEDEFENEAATELATDDALWKHHDDAKPAGPSKARVSSALIPRSSLPATQRPSPVPAAALPSARKPPSPSTPPPRPTPNPVASPDPVEPPRTVHIHPPSRPVPRPPVAAPMSAAGPSGPLTLQGPGAPPPAAAAASFPPMQPSYPPPPLAPAPGASLSPQPFGAAAPVSYELRGGLQLFIAKHATRLWIAGGVALVLLVILSMRDCGQTPAPTNRGPAADPPAEK